jgi:PAS domain S-box-containing protein
MDGIISVNEAQEVVMFNAAAEKMFGCPAATAIGQSIHRFLPERFRNAHKRQIHEFGKTGMTARSMGGLPCLSALRSDGTEFPIEATISRIEVGGQKVFSVILRDVSERKRAEAEREQLLRDAEKQAYVLQQQASRVEATHKELLRLAAEAAAANRAKSDFLAVMSHELRTPLNAIAGYTELLEMGVRGPVTAAQVSDLKRIQKSQKHLLGLINEVLNFAKLETGRVEYYMREFRVATVLSGLEVLVRPQLQAKELHYQYVCADPQLTVYADHEKMRQVLLNLISNAIKFTPDGGMIILSSEGQGASVLIRVKDTGRGIPVGHLESIFEPFVQVDRRLTREFDGVGLGLAISRDLARGMGGTLTAASEIGVGATFTLVLRQRNPESPAAHLDDMNGIEELDDTEPSGHDTQGLIRMQSPDQRSNAP